MALKRNNNGQFVIKSKAEAARAFAMMETLQGEIAELEKEHGIDEMKMDCVELKKAATAYMADNSVDTLKFGDGRKAVLVTAVNQKRWIGTNADLENVPDGVTGVKPLRSLVSKEVWMKITTRIPDPQKIEEAVSEGIVTTKKIAPAYVETFKAPYAVTSDA